MIEVTDIRGRKKIINADLIEMIEANPDTQVLLTNGHRIYTRETPEEIAERVVDFKRRCHQQLAPTISRNPADMMPAVCDATV